MLIKNALKNSTIILQKSSPTPFLDSQLLLCYTLNVTIEFVILNMEKKLALKDYKYFLSLIKERTNMKPIAYITQKKDFFGYTFFVNEQVLIPRPDTETLVNLVLTSTKQDEHLELLELGTGSGCVIISILLNMKNVNATATDISKAVLEVTKINAGMYNLLNRLTLIQSNWFHNINQKFDIIICNPPYININDLHLISREVIEYEPKIALFASMNGLKAYHDIAKQAYKFLKPKGKIFVECGFNQSSSIKKIFNKYDYKIEVVKKDLSSHNRVLKIKKNKYSVD